MGGKLAVISGFSGAGKGTVIKKLMEEHDGYVLSVSMTTRRPREYERDGVEYHFVTNETFEGLVRQDGFLEHAGYVDHYYGTPRAFVEENMRAGKTVLLEIEVQGAMQIREKFPEAVLIFVAPPDAAELQRRLRGRDTEKSDLVIKQLEQALTEVRSIPEYPWLVINRDVDDCARDLDRILSGDPGVCVPQGGPENAGIITDQDRKRSFAQDFSGGLERVLAES